MMWKQILPERFMLGCMLALYGVLAGIAGGVAAVFFRFLIGGFHNLFFYGKWSGVYDAALPTAPSIWGMGIIIVPVVGAFLVSYIARLVGTEIRGSGVPNVMRAIYFRAGKIHWSLALGKSFAAAISIGSGASIGREGPIVQISSSLGALLGRRQSPAIRGVLIAAAAAAGVSGTFHSPLGGLFFAIEILLPSVTALTLLPVILAVVTANLLATQILGEGVLYQLPEQLLAQWSSVAWGGSWSWALVGVGVLSGGLGAVFVLAVRAFGRGFDRLSQYYLLRYAVGMLIVGCELGLLWKLTGYYYIDGVNFYGAIELLAGNMTIALILLLLVAKLLATVISLASGASGGVFSPLIFCGAMIGGVAAWCIQQIFPFLDVPIALLVLAGMAATVGCATGAVFAGALTVAEMFGAPETILPLLIAAIVAYAVRKIFCRDNVYNGHFRRELIPLPEGLSSNWMESVLLKEVMQTRIRVVQQSKENSLKPQQLLQSCCHKTVILQDDDGHCKLYRKPKNQNAPPPEQREAAVQLEPILSLQESMVLSEALQRQRRWGGSAIAVVNRQNRVVGVVDHVVLGEISKRFSDLLL